MRANLSHPRGWSNHPTNTPKQHQHVSIDPPVRVSSARDAVALVCRMSREERQRAARGSDRILRELATWPEDDPDGWRDVVARYGCIWAESPDTNASPKGTLRYQLTRERDRIVAQTWAEKLWLDADLAAQLGLTLLTIRAYRRTVLRESIWRYQIVGPHRKAYQLCEAIWSASERVSIDDGVDDVSPDD